MTAKPRKPVHPKVKAASAGGGLAGAAVAVLAAADINWKAVLAAAASALVTAVFGYFKKA